MYNVNYFIKFQMRNKCHLYICQFQNYSFDENYNLKLENSKNTVHQNSKIGKDKY